MKLFAVCVIAHPMLRGNAAAFFSRLHKTLVVNVLYEAGAHSASEPSG